MSVKKPECPTRTTREWLEEADRAFRSAVVRLMTCSTTMLAWESGIDWSSFRAAMTELQRCAEDRHAAKHATMIEALKGYSAPLAVMIGTSFPHPNPAPPESELVGVCCGDVEWGKVMVVCECGGLRQADRPHGYEASLHPTRG